MGQLSSCLAVLALLAVPSLGPRGIAAGEQCTPWELISPHPHGRNLTDVLWAGNRFVAVGYSVTQWSANGETWKVATHDDVHLNRVASDGSG